MNQFGKAAMMSYDEYKFYGYEDLDKINAMLKRMFNTGMFSLNYCKRLIDDPH